MEHRPSTHATSYAFAEILKLADNFAQELTAPGARCQVPVILAVTAVEALLSDLPHLRGRYGKDEGVATPGSTGERAKRMRLRDRLGETSLLVTGKSLAAGRDPYQGFSILVELRNAIVHRKPEEWLEQPDGEKTPVGKLPGFVQYLSKVAPGAVTVQDLLTPGVARWAVLAAGGIVEHFLLGAGEKDPTLAFVLAALLQPHFGGDGRGSDGLEGAERGA